MDISAAAVTQHADRKAMCLKMNGSASSLCGIQTSNITFASYINAVLQNNSILATSCKRNLTKNGYQVSSFAFKNTKTP